MMARQGRRAAFAVIALIFALAVLALAEATGWLALRLRVEAIPATLILLGINLVIAAIFGVLAARSSPGHTEQEALRVRRQALDAARGTLAFTAAVPAVTTSVGDRQRTGPPPLAHPLYAIRPGEPRGSPGLPKQWRLRRPCAGRLSGRRRGRRHPLLHRRRAPPA